MILSQKPTRQTPHAIWKEHTQIDREYFQSFASSKHFHKKKKEENQQHIYLQTSE